MRTAMTIAALLFCVAASLAPAASQPATTAPASAAGGPQGFQPGVSGFSTGCYDDNSIHWQGANSPGLTMRVEGKEWPQLQLAGLNHYIYIFYGKERDMWAKRLGSFGRVLPAVGAQVKEVTPGKPTWNGRAYELRWEQPQPGRMQIRVSNLVPGVQIESDSSQLVLFNNTGKAPPSYAAMATASGLRVARLPIPEGKAEGDYGRVACGEMSEPWLLVWFADSPGMKDVQYGGEMVKAAYKGADCPWLIVLQHRAKSLATGEYGLRLEFDGPCGQVLAMPLYGTILQRPEQTRQWADGLPREVLERVRFWAGVLRMLPDQCREEFAYDPAGKVTIRESFSYRATQDDWQTAPVRIAPLSPAVGICRMYQKTFGLPLEFPQPLKDAGYLSQWGPYIYAADTDQVSFTVTGLGRYTDQMLSVQPSDSEISKQVLRRLEGQVRAFVAVDKTLIHATWSSNENGPVYLGARPEQVWALARCLPLLPANLRGQAKEYLRKLIRDDLASPANWRAGGTVYGEPAMLYSGAKGPLNVWMDWQAPRVLYALWAYGQYTDDWELVRQHWPLLRGALNGAVLGQEYASFMSGQPHVPLRLNMGMNGLIAAARLAQRMGDPAAQARANYLLARNIVAWVAQWNGPNYLQFCEPREEQWHALRVYGNIFGSQLPKLRSSKGTFLDTRTQSWWPQEGFSWCTDPTLFSAPWSEVFLEASPELLRFCDDYFHEDVADQFDFVLWIWPLMFNEAFSYQTGFGQWGFASPYLRVAAFVKHESPRQLLEWLPDAQMPEDPFYLENLLAILYAEGKSQWVPVSAAKP